MNIALSSASLIPDELERRSGRPADLSQLLWRAAEWRPLNGLRFLHTDGREALLSHAELLDQAKRIAAGLQARGTEPGSKVALLLDDADDFLPAFWGTIFSGAVPVPLAPIRNDAERWAQHLAYVDELLDAPLFLSSPAYSRDLSGFASVGIEDLRTGDAAAFEPHRAKPENPALLVLTSGSTGNAKAVTLTHANLLASLPGKAERQELSADDVTLNWISFDHVAALIETHLLPLYVGATQFHANPGIILADPLQFLRLIAAHRVTMTFTPNFLLGQINVALQEESASRELFDLAALRHIISGGEAVRVETGRRFLDLLAPHGLSSAALWPAFGMTETCAGSIYSRNFPDGDANRELAALGAPIAGIAIRIVDEQDHIVQDGQPGELQLRGPIVFGGYHNNPDATRAAFTSDGWFRSGDLGVIENGQLSLIGRSKDSIIVSGVNYFSHELEAAIEQLAGVEKSYVAAFPTRPYGVDTEQLVIAFAPTSAPDDEAAIHRLVIAIRNTAILLWGFRPSLILPLPKTAFPKTSLGKIQRATLRKRLEAGELADAERAIADLTSRQLGGYSTPATPAETIIAGIYAAMFGVPAETISATASFFDLGGTSLDILKLKKHVEQALGLTDLPILTILQNPTVRALALQAGRADEPRAYDPIVTLQSSGDKTPLFCVHPGVGEILVFVNLAKYFVNERPFHALRARGFNEGEVFFTRFDEMVESYVEAIRARQPQGPYAIAGYSYGGAVAFEIAKVLEAQGERVDFVGIFNLPPHIKYRMDELDPVEGAVNLAFFLSLIDKDQSTELPGWLRAQPDIDPYRWLIDNAPPERLVELDLDLAKFTAWAGLAQSLLTMGRSYEPSGSAEQLSIFYAIPLRGTKEDWLQRELKRWDDFSRSANRYIDVAGEHYTLMGPRHVATFQSVLRAELDRALGGK